MFICPRCNAQNQNGVRFCSNCGIAFTYAPPTQQQPIKRKNSISVPLIVIGCVLGMCVFCGIIGKLSGNKSQQNTSQPQTVASTPAPTAAPPLAFAEIKTKSERLLSISQENYETVNLDEFETVIKPLREMPKDSRDYKPAQALLKKLIDKSSVVAAERIVLGEKPAQSGWDGDVLPVKQYLRATLNDYDSSEFVEWSPVTKVYVGKEPYWGVRLKLRAKNGFGGLILRDTFYFIRNNKVVISKGLGAD
jgi:hypothetical protein